MAEEFVTPEFIDNSDPDTIQSRMMNNLPVDISDMPADFPYDFTMPTAIEISRLIQYNLTRTLMLMFQCGPGVNGLICMEYLQRLHESRRAEHPVM